MSETLREREEWMTFFYLHIRFFGELRQGHPVRATLRSSQAGRGEGGEERKGEDQWVSEEKGDG